MKTFFVNDIETGFWNIRRNSDTDYDNIFENSWHYRIEISAEADSAIQWVKKEGKLLKKSKEQLDVKLMFSKRFSTNVSLL